MKEFVSDKLNQDKLISDKLNSDKINCDTSKLAVCFIHERIFIRQIEIGQIELRHKHDELLRLLRLTLKYFSSRQIKSRQIEMGQFK